MYHCTGHQFEFTSVRTREATLASRTWFEKRLDMNRWSCLAIVDLEIAFDNVRG